jgi:hypothetical protein
MAVALHIASLRYFEIALKCLSGEIEDLGQCGLAPGKRRALLKERGAFHGQAAETVREGI